MVKLLTFENNIKNAIEIEFEVRAFSPIITIVSGMKVLEK